MPSLEINNVTKKFGRLTANDDVSLRLGEGEVLALLGENGAGKTTLMNILFGHYVADTGSIAVDGKNLPAGSTDAAIRAGIGMVHQHFTLAENMTVLENIMLGSQSLFSLHSQTRAARKRLATLSRQYRLEVDPDQHVDMLSVGERQRVEILKVLYRGARILILDEPTAVLTIEETETLFDNLRAMVGDGMSIIFISHKLNEVTSISDRVTVLHHGAVVAEVKIADVDRHELATMMVGREVTRPKKQPSKIGGDVLRLENLSANAAGTGHLRLSNINLEVRSGEIVGIAGVAGNGQSVLVDLLCGMLAPSAGRFLLSGNPVTQFAPSHFIANGIARIPEDRHHTGTIGEMSVWENLVAEDLRKPPVWRWGRVIDFNAARARAKELIEQFDIRCDSIDQPARLLSGGNMQKLILARVLSRSPIAIIANQPVRGLDEGAISFVHEQLLTARANGVGVVLISEDLDEILSLADRVAVMYHGRLGPVMDADAVSIGEIGAMMGGHFEQTNKDAA